ncbi:MAG: acetyl-CoA carboxylase biotin carboxyl carrier protein [Cyanobacteria bacterium P01_E01_bin.34]
MSSINWQEIRNLLAAIDQSDVVEFSLEAEDFRLTVSKSDRGAVVTSVVEPPVAVADTQPASAAPSAPISAPSAPTVPPPTAPARSDDPPSDWVPITAPIVGTYYSAPAPGEPAFVSPGDLVTEGQTVCIIEAMKVMNELLAEIPGRITEILVENAEPVEFGQVVMYVDPS